MAKDEEVFEETDPGMYMIFKRQCAIHALLKSITSGESNQIVDGVDTINGLEAYRKLIRRWDPTSGE